MAGGIRTETRLATKNAPCYSPYVAYRLREQRRSGVEKYETADGNCPFDDWFNELGDRSGQARIDARIARLRLGSFGEWDDVGEGVIEMIFKGKGPGYRVYFGQDGLKLVIILGGGSKQTQRSDIKKAKECWEVYTR